MRWSTPRSVSAERNPRVGEQIASAAQAAVRAVSRALVEKLEPRQLLAGVQINEFLANNNNGIVDSDGDHSDWIELKNTDATSVNLSGWSLTDDATNLTKWTFPSTTIAAGGYLIVWASQKNRAVAGQQLHTNFLLDGDNGEYLALVKPGGTIVADSYDPFPPQEPDVSYGRAASAAATDTLIDVGASTAWKVPTAATSIDSTWKNSNFTPDGTWTTSTIGVGYDTNTSGTNYLPYIGAGSNVQSQMSGFTRSLYMRLNFNVADPNAYAALRLKMLYDDGFAVFLNGTRLNGAVLNGTTLPNADRAAPATLAWNSLATASRTDSSAIVYETIDLSAAIGLLVAGNNVLSIQGLNVDPTSSDLLMSPLLEADRSIPGTAGYMVTPSPGAANNVGTLGFVGDTHFSVDRGFYDTPQDVTITTSTPGATIRYTLDGTAPTSTSGTIYTAPIHITTTKTLRAIAYKTGWTSTDVDTETYIFLNDVIHQTGTGLPAFTTWGHNGPDWAMDPNIVNNPTYSGTIINDMKAVPTMSLVMPWSDWFGSQGIYPVGSSVEKAGSVEMFSASDPDVEFHSDSAIEIQGASSTTRWNEDKLSMRLTFKPPFGPTKLDTTVFDNPTFDNGATTQFDRLVLDAMYDDTWMDPSSTNRSKAKEVQDQYAADLMNAAGGHSPHGRFVQLYLNGLYWGMYYLHEEPDDRFASEYLGGSKDDYDVVKHNGSTVVAGGSQATTDYNSMITATGKDMTVLANYNAVAAKLDIDSFIDYMLVNYYIGNTDWSDHNWYASFNRVDPNGRWRFQAWDSELSLQDVATDNTLKNQSASPTYIQNRLMTSPEYKQRFNDEVQRLMANGGVLSPTGAAAIYQSRVNEIDRAIVGESARWGDNHGTPALTRAGWRATQDGMQTSYFPQRTGVVMGQFTSRGWIISQGAPTYSQFGGSVNPGYQLTISKPSGTPVGATIYYTLDGTDPRVAGTGAVAGTASAYAGPITINVSRRVKARILNGTTWSAIVDATFFSTSVLPVRISELHYHPADSESHEFIELVNTSASSIDLSGVQITKFASPSYVFPSDITLGAGQRIVVANNRTAFQALYGMGVNLAPGEYQPGNLSNGGEEIALLSAAPVNQTIEDFTYGDNTAPGWPTTPDGGGPSLEITDPLGDPSDPANWHASFVIGGTPGTAGSPPTAQTPIFQFDTGHAIRIQFDHDLDQSSVATTDLDVTLLPGGSIFHPNSVTFPDSKTALFNFATPLADGNYHAMLASGSVKDAGGLATTAASDLDFYALNGDANRDRHVDALDQAILTAHLNQAGTFSLGDFDLNGSVNSADQTILNNQLKLWLPAVGALPLTATTGDDAYKLKKESATILDLYAGTDVAPTYRLMTAGVSSITFAGGAGDDALTIDASAGLPLGSIPLSFDGGNAGTDVLNIIGTAGADAVTFNSGSVILGSTINDAGVESLTFNTGGGADALAINDASVALAASGKVSSLTLNPNATLDLGDRSLVIDYTSATVLASTTAMIATAHNGGQWNLPGIITSQTLAKLPSWQATLGIAEASDVVNFAGHATAVWNGQTVDQTAVLIRYTFAGDANLDGVINGDDYFLIDAHAVVGGYHNGDFDYSSNVNADDYFLIDSNYNKAQTPLAALAMARAGPALPPAIAVAFPQSPPAEHKLLDELL